MEKAYLEDYLESVEGFPRDFCLTLEETQSKDREFQEFRSQVSKKQSGYFKTLKKGVTNEQTEALPAAVRNDYMALLQLINQKIQIAESASEMLDRQYRKLEHDLKLFEHDMEEERMKKEDGTGEKKSLKRKLPEIEPPVVIPKNTPGRKRKLNDTESGENVDPDEPVYCVCRQVSFGEMVACDDNECPLEWFHYQCVGLTSKPRGTWYCTECMLRRKGLTNNST